MTSRRKKPTPKNIRAHITKNFLDTIILQMVQEQPIHGYQVMAHIRKTFGVYFGPSTIYPLLKTLEDNGYLESTWDSTATKPKKVYTITADGKDLLKMTEISLMTIYPIVLPDATRRHR